MHVSNLLESGKKIKLQEKLIIFSKKRRVLSGFIELYYGV